MDAQQDRATQLRQHFVEVRLPLDLSARRALQARVRAYVGEAKERGVPPERVIVAVKRMAHEAGLRPSARVVLTMPHTPLNAKDQLLAELVGWCIERYYASA